MAKNRLKNISSLKYRRKNHSYHNISGDVFLEKVEGAAVHLEMFGNIFKC